MLSVAYIELDRLIINSISLGGKRFHIKLTKFTFRNKKQTFFLIQTI